MGGFVAKEFNGANDSEAEFSLLMGQLGKILVIFATEVSFCRRSILSESSSCIICADRERNLQARAIVQYLLEVIAPCSSA